MENIIVKAAEFGRTGIIIPHAIPCYHHDMVETPEESKRISQARRKIRVGRIWLPVQYGDKEIRFSYPPVEGEDEEECFQAIKKDKEIRPAEGLELALLVFAAYKDQQEQWKDIREYSINHNYVRIPVKNLWIPAGTFAGDKTLSGVLVERVTKASVLETRMQIPNLADSSQWKQNAEEIYVHQKTDAKFIPSDKYKLGKQTAKSFAENKYAQAMLTPEGAEVFAKAAVDARKKLYISETDFSDGYVYEKGDVYDMSEAHRGKLSPKMDSPKLGECSDGLALGNNWNSYTWAPMFGVFQESE